MGSGVSQFARCGGAFVRADAGVAGTSAVDGDEYRQSGTARRFSRAKFERRRRAETIDPGTARRREARPRSAETPLRATRDCPDSGKIAQRCRVAVFRCAAPSVFEIANQSDSARAWRRRNWKRRADGTTAYAFTGSEAPGRSHETGRARIEAARFHSAGESRVFGHRE